MNTIVGDWEGEYHYLSVFERAVELLGFFSGDETSYNQLLLTFDRKLVCALGFI